MDADDNTTSGGRGALSDSYSGASVSVAMAKKEAQRLIEPSQATENCCLGVQ